jgi:formylglycine-generating enzyme required for sulfatase activity/pimeloyl-ACP methyl ester carboxylesterase
MNYRTIAAFAPFLLSVLLTLLITIPIAAKSAATPCKTDSAQALLSASELQDIQAAHEAWQHALRPVEGGWQAHNPAQQWMTTFDGRGFVARPKNADWTWGLELRGYGAGDERRELSRSPVVKTSENRLAYHWDGTVQEWFVNDGRGLEHGFSVQERPPGPPDAPLTFVMATRGPLRAEVTGDARGVEYRDEDGKIVLTYAGLRVWDAEGRELDSRFVAAKDGVELQVDAEGARYPLTIDPIAKQANLLPDEFVVQESFGTHVDISGNTAVVGSIDSETSEPLATVYVKGDTGWTREAVLRAEYAYGNDRAFMYSVAVSGQTVVIGCEQVFEPGKTGFRGGVFVFVRKAPPNGPPTWEREDLLHEPGKELSSAGTEFGCAVDISGDTLIVGAALGGGINSGDNIADDTGIGYIFKRMDGAWTGPAVLRANNPDYGDNFGASVAVSGDTAVVGAPYEDGPGNSDLSAGAAYVFIRGSGGAWSQQAYLRASNAEAEDLFGSEVAISNNDIVVGAHYEDSAAKLDAGGYYSLNGAQTSEAAAQGDNSASDAGAAYVFARSGTVWSQQAYLKMPDTVSNAFFGASSVTVEGDFIVIRGQVYQRRPGVNWRWKANLEGAGFYNALSGQAVVANSTGSTAVIYALEPRLPVVFLHGVSGSVLKTGNRTIWPTITPSDVADLHTVTGPADAEAVDIVREYNVGGLGVEVLQFYGPFLRNMTNAHGYIEFQMQGDRSRMTNSHISTLTNTTKPDLFVFPYDWRQPNASHTAILRAYLKNISDLHGGKKVNLVVHSMGGLVMRRYLLDYGADLVGRVVTVASPLWGAPESAYRMFTGIFFDKAGIDFVNSSAMKDSVLSMPAVHELNPSTRFYQNWGLPVFTEEGLDYDQNGIKNEGYDANRFRASLDELAYPQTPGANNVNFHDYLGGRQDDWSTDTNGIEFLHIIGKQAVNHTTIGIRARPKTLLESIKPTTGSFLPPIVSGYGVIERVYGEGDGTVPTLGSTRLTSAYAPNTLVRVISEPLAETPSEKQPEGQAAEHTAIMANTNAWNMINAFLETGTAPSPPVASSSLRKTTAVPPNSRTAGAKVALAAGAPILRITEIMSALNSGVGSTPYTSDWVEVTNYGAAGANLTGYTLMDPSSGLGMQLAGVADLAPGESAVFVRTAAPATDLPAFRSIWALPSHVKVGTYAPAWWVLMQSDRDGAVLQDFSNTEVTRVDYHGGAKNRSFVFVYDGNGSRVATGSVVSTHGFFGAYNSAGSPPDVGSPGVPSAQTTRAVAMETMPVGDIRNSADTNGHGAVDYAYRIGKFEVTLGQYTAFLNSVAKSDPYGLYSTNMASDVGLAGITRSNSSGSFTYSVTGPNGSQPVGASSPSDRPVVYISWFDMARFCNWLHNGATNGADTETGAYTLNGATNGTAPARNEGAKWRLPTENEWYKAAYYKGGGTNTGYWPYATGNTNLPNNSISTRTNANQANFYRNRYTVTASTSYSGTQNYHTEVGAFTASTSAYGTCDQTGNVFELNELAGAGDTNRGFRGGGWYYDSASASSSYRVTNQSASGSAWFLGFRVATVAWPSPGLSALSLSDGNLSPAFAPETTSYVANVPNSVASITLRPTTADTVSSITVGGAIVNSGTPTDPINLNVGTNSINVVVTAGDGATTKAYSLTVTRPPSTNAELSALSVSDVTLSPDFSGSTTSYAASVGNNISAITITPTLSEDSATVTVNGSVVAAGAASDPIKLNVGTNKIDVVVTAQDGITAKTYTLILTRAVSLASYRKQILVTGCGYVSVRDAQTGDDNAAYSAIAVKRIPGVEATYNDEAGWALFDFDGSRDIRVESVPGQTAAEVEVITTTATGALVDIARYRSVSGPASWQLTIPPGQSASLSIDSNGNGTYEAGETVAPDFVGSGSGVDMNPPDIGLMLSLVGENIRVEATGSDNSAFNIRYQIDNEPVSIYSSPLLLPRRAQNHIAIYAEDALGNTSGVIRTRLNPQLSLRAGAASSFELEWPEADGYRLQTAVGLDGPWTNVPTIPVISGGRVSTTVSPGASKAFYRLSAYPVSR